MWSSYISFCCQIDTTQATILVDATGSARITDVGLATIDGRGTYNKEEDIFAFAMVVIAVRCRCPAFSQH